jgi:hypothetical protein
LDKVCNFIQKFKAMDLQTRKINFIQDFLKIRNEEVVSRFEKLLRKEKENIPDSNLSPMTIDDLNKRIDLSLTDSKNDNITEANDLVDEISKWN